MTTSSKPSLQTIADRAKVSRAAVSLALRNQPGISEATRNRIKQIAREEGYRPNPMVSALMAHLKTLRPMPDSGSLPFLTAFPTRNEWRKYPAFLRYYEGARERAQQAGYELEEIWMREPGMTTKKLRSILLNRGVEGILVAPLSKGMGHLSLDLSTFAVATLGYSVIRPKLHRAAAHHTESLRMAVHELRNLGYQRIALAMSESQDRRNNFLWSTAYAGFDLTRAPKNRIPLFFLDRTSSTQCKSWLEKWKPDVILSGSAEIIPRLSQAGFSVPSDLGVAILDRSPNDIGVAGIDQQLEAVGAAAVDIIVSQINRNERGVPEQPKLILTEGRWVMGETLRKLRRKSLPPTQAETKKSIPQRRTARPKKVG